jgi:hypothetical protein
MHEKWFQSTKDVEAWSDEIDFDDEDIMTGVDPIQKKQYALDGTP